jgi:hypothetical protein
MNGGEKRAARVFGFDIHPFGEVLPQRLAPFYGKIRSYIPHKSSVPFSLFLPRK